LLIRKTQVFAELIAIDSEVCQLGHQLWKRRTLLEAIEKRDEVVKRFFHGVAAMVGKSKPAEPFRIPFRMA
jgi:hypothetical protein